MSQPNPSQASLQAILAARQAQPKPDFSYTCDNCHEEVPWKRCKSNDNGNEGRWMAVCRKFSGEKACTFFRWLSGSKSPSGSPTLGASPVLQPVQLSDATLLLICTALACKKKAHSLCDNKTCRKHCGLLGGCSVKGHGLAVVPSPASDVSRSPSPLTSIPNSPPPVPGPSQPKRRKMSHSSSPSQSFFFLEVARKASHTSSPSQSIFLDSKGKGQATASSPSRSPSILPRKASVPAHSPSNHYLEVAERMKNNIIVYAWSKDGAEPIIYEFQQGFTFPNFFFSHNILQKLNMLPNTTSAPLRVQRYNRLLETWIMFDMGHMVTLQPRDGGILLVRDARVKDCIGFGDHLHKLTRPGEPKHNMRNLSRPSSVLSLTDSDDDTRPACTIKRRHSTMSLTDDSEDDDDDSSYLPSALGPVIKEECPGSVLARGGSKSNAIEVEKVSIWPADFYVVDIADGFIACKRAEDSRCSIADAFVRHFGVPFRASTFYDNRRVWERGANRVLRAQFISYGRVDEGRWAAFVERAECLK